MKWSLISGRFWIAFATIAVVGLLFAYYFLNYIPVREDQLLGKKYRALQRIAKNFSEMHDNYVNSVELLIGQHNPDSTNKWIDKMNVLQRNDTVRNPAGVLETIRKEFETKRDEMKNELIRSKVELVTPTRLGRSRHYREGEYVFIKRYFRVKVSDLITNEDIIDNNFDRLLVIRMFRGMANLKKGQEQRDSVVVAYQGRRFEEANGAESKILLNDISFLFDTAQVFRTIPMHKVRIAGKPFRVLSYIVEIGGQDWVMCGLVSEASIRADIRKVDLFLLIMLVLVALFLLLSMPVLKLLIMSSIERLQILNVWFIGFSIVTGASLITILLLVAHHYVNYKDDYREKLENLSHMVTTKFRSEIDNIVLQMSNVNRAFPENILKSQYDYALTNTSGIRMRGDSLTYKYFNELLFLNERGKVPLVFANHMLPKASSDLPDLSQRKYFSQPMAENLLYFTPDSPKFYIQSIRSWNSGKHEAGVSVKTDLIATMAIGANVDKEISTEVQFAVIATATRLRSVMNPLLPPGYQFCIMDEDGEALFHSDIKKNLQENFLDEIDHDYLAEAIIAGKSSHQVEVSYSGRKCLAYIAPLTQSMFLVTLLDQEYYNTPIVLTFGGVWVLTATMMLLLGIQLILLFCITYRSSKLQIRRFSLSWVGPRSDEKAPDFSIRYARCIAAMSMIAVVLVIIYFLGFSLCLSVGFVTLPMLLLAAHYASFYDADPENNLPLYRNRFVIASLLMVSIVTIAALSQVEFLTGLSLFMFQAVILALIVSNLYTNMFAALHEWIAERLRTERLYSTFLYCWLLLVGVLPVFYLYKTAFVHENFLWKKFIQWEAYHVKKSRSALLKKEFAEMGYFRDGTQIDTAYISKDEYLDVSDQFGDYHLCDIDNFDTTATRAIDEDLIEAEEFEFRPAFVGPLERSRSALIANPEVFKWFARSSRDGLFLTDEGQIMYSSLIQPFTLYKGKYAAAFALVFVLFFYALFVLIRTCVRYIFGLGLLQPRAPLNLIDLIEESLKEGCHKVFLVGLPYSGKSELLRNIRSKHIVKEIFLRTDLDSPMDLSSYDLFIVHNFEHALNDQAMNEKRLQLFINLQRNRKASILVTSTVQPDSILDVLEGRIKQMIQDRKTEEKDKTALQKEINSMRNAHRVWKNILSGFEILFKPLSVADEPTTFLERELGIGNFLPRLKKYFTDTRNDNEEEIVLQIESRASAYYQSLWNSFTRKEKHALFDLAKDRFLNLRDAGKVRMLMNKGIIVMKDSPQIMNRSFNNFILSVVKEDEALAMTNELRRKGSWAGLQLVLVIMLVSVAIFVAFVQQEILTSINAMVLTISSVVALLAKFSGIFGGSKPKE